jgi:multidrug efflux pump
VLTLLTTPVVYILMDKLRRRSPEEANLSRNPVPATPGIPPAAPVHP